MTPRAPRPDDLDRLVTVTETAIRPDGSAVVVARREVAAGRSVTSLWEIGEDGAQRRLTHGPDDGGLGIGAAGLLFLRPVDGVPQLHLLPETGEPVQLTSLPLGAGRPVADATGRRIAFLAPVERGAGDPQAPIVVDTLDQKADGAGWTGSVRHQIVVLDLDDGSTRQVTDGDEDAGEPAWSPDGTLLAYTAGTSPRADVERERAVHVLTVDDPLSPPRVVGAATGVTGPLLWTPDGGSVVAVGYPTMAIGHARLLRLHLDGRPDEDLTAGLDLNVMPGAVGYPGGRPALTHDGQDVVFCARDRGWTHLYRVALAGGAPRPVVAEEHRVVSALSVAAQSSRAAVVVTSQESFGEVALVDLATGDHRELTTLTRDALPDVELLRPEPRSFTISDGTVVHGWILAAPTTEGPAPLLLDIHGGPHNAWSGVADDMHLYHQVLAHRGWRVLTLNPRGSDGYGEDFLTAVFGGWAQVDLPDFLEPVDALVAEGLADPDRLAVTGYSYGGLSTCALTAHTDRFAAAVAGGLLCDFAAVAGQRLVPEGFFSAATAGLEPTDVVRLTELSPIARVGRVTTPTLVLHGERDETCPSTQAQEWFSALRIQGVPTRLVVYPGAGHVFVAAGPVEHRIDYQRRVVEWVERYTRTGHRTPSTAVAPAARDAAAWQRRLDLLRDRYGVVGAQLGIVQLGAGEGAGVLDRVTVSSGVLDVSTGVPVTDDAVFQIGSISKVWTTMLVLQLVEEGRLDLDAPVRSVVPDFRLRDDDAPTITVRELLHHTSGLDGDLFTDTGRGDDCVAKYVELLNGTDRLHPRGERFSYCNSAFVVAGRIIEVLRGATWDEALRSHLIEPLGLAHTFTSTDDAPRFLTATGHDGAGASAVPVSTWGIPRSMGPAGLINASIGDLLTFAETALREGLAPNGTRILSAESARLMTVPHVDLRTSVVGKTGWGLGWFLQDWQGSSVYGHDGGTIGQRAYLRIFPDSGLAVALLTSGGRSDGLYRELFDDAARTLDGGALHTVAVPDPTTAPAPLAGSWESAGFVADIAPADGGLRLRLRERMGYAGGADPDRVRDLALHASTIPGVYTYTGDEMAGAEAVRPVPGGLYHGHRFLREVRG
ncbi:serine hydrolase [Pimelobacter simplex]|uniref:Beta-lactamase n=2 Tax=Nocardioides simplex TaxID=2045 RepID=A0A0A1DK20_NOCSI|nr:serine hydrolase [Pimelobacter simplex]AIY16923.1 Beta-lactamase [Pimelobacter simplex]GEB12816.1 serine hydrolase [Pimelobacter simplex]SFM53822.1 Dipeptidyl aminopeptidase/acylaminoacyl peptidase [Pimelobacter simplex]